MLTKDKLIEEKLALLKLELTNLTSKINNSVDSLWKIRTVAMAIWTAAMGYGLDPVRSNNDPLIAIILITILIPLWFFWIDARYNRWYRRIMFREWQIQQFINSREYKLPKTNEEMSFNQLTEREDFLFPVYDLTGDNTYGNDPDFNWQVSLLRNWVDSIPVFVYGSQMLVSAVVSSMYLSSPWRYIVVPSVIIFFSAITVAAKLKRKKIFAEAERETST